MTPDSTASEGKGGKGCWWVVVWLAVAICLLCGCTLKRCSGKHIHDYLLTTTPVGTPYSQVLGFVEQHRWKKYEVRNGYFMRPKPGAPEIEVGRKHIRACLGGYQGLPFWTDVECVYAFDSDDGLIDIFVVKFRDAL